MNKKPKNMRYEDFKKEIKMWLWWKMFLLEYEELKIRCKLSYKIRDFLSDWKKLPPEVRQILMVIEAENIHANLS